MTEPSDIEFLGDPEPAPAAAAPRPRRRWFVPAAAALVLAAGGTASYVAFASGQSGADSPTAAVQQAMTDLGHSDLLGLIDDLTPGERDVFAPAIRADVTQLQRLQVLSSAADPSAVGGFAFRTDGLTYASATTAITDDVQVVTIDGGTLTASSDVSKLPLTDLLLDKAAAAAGAQRTSTTTIDFAHSPRRLAAQQVGGRWYVSLGYTVADQVVRHRVPPAAGAITPAGAPSGQQALRAMLDDLAGSDVRGALSLLSPSELGAVQTYGGLLSLPGPSPDPAFHIEKLTMSSTSLGGGYEAEKLTGIDATTPFGRISATVDAKGCSHVALGSTHKTFCTSDLPGLINRIASQFACLGPVALGGLGGGSADFGWYPYSPLRAPGSASVSWGSGSAFSSGTGFVPPAGGPEAVAPTTVPTVGAPITVRPSRHGAAVQGFAPGDGPSVGAGTDGPYSSSLSITCAAQKVFDDAQLAALGRLFDGLSTGGVVTQQVGGRWYVAPLKTLADTTANALAALHDDDILTLFSLHH